MSRRRRQMEKEVFPDPKYKSIILSQFINTVMKKGKKSLAEKIVYDALDILGEKTNEPPLDVFYQAVDNVKPLIKVVSRRIGGSNYQVPTEVTPKTAQALAFRWIISYARARSEKTMVERLAGELLAAYKKEGASIKKREDVHKMAESNKAFAHFRF
ncbi:MAG: 30S ribosomal protein S7 [Candidatus Cloacimonetes bacterium]|nr:30S ribosomal protein S7 [Candidatus Cloacimonadota bacterium]MCF7814959.1 30S ribosomal protein S7 [Candidatus Cloacimonadota bacterium]MCF7869229.1 30S ribosomal protein S7 [Candidatus Cloacimonadota bacterium]MCF7884646.1 30S ribosomal protein S7 [Candidatus Cloacimonadota bacterium]